MSEFLFQLVENLMRGGHESRDTMLDWIGSCLRHNKGRTGEMSKHGGSSQLYSNTGMFLNIGLVLLRISNKMLKKDRDRKLENICSSYLKLKKMRLVANKLEPVESFFDGFDNEVAIVPGDNHSINISNIEDHYHLVNKLFFLTHIALDIGMNQAHVELRNIGDVLAELRDCEQALKREDHSGAVFFKKLIMTPNGPAYQTVAIKDETEMKRILCSYNRQYYCLRTAMMSLEMRKELDLFLSNTLTWLLRKCDIDQEERQVSPENNHVPDQLKIVPEFVLENVYYFLKLENTRLVYGKFKEKVFSATFQMNVINLYLYLMRSSFIKNPHWKAKFAEGISMLLPEENRDNIAREAALLQPASDVSLLQPEVIETANSLFREISCKKQVVEALLHVYVSLEIAGDSLGDTKFNYRYTINYVLMYLLTIREYREIMIDIAAEAHNNMSNMKSPIFLKFVNGMLNDGTSLLEESLLKMKAIKKAEHSLQDIRISPREKMQLLEDLKGKKKTTRNMNLLSADLLCILEAFCKLTSDVFTHPDIADRLAAMLNYFLESLTGKDRKQFKILSPGEVSFNPVKLLTCLKHIYCSLSHKKSFIAAISQDGRSYDPRLFEEAAQILRKHEDTDDLISLLNDVKEVSKEVGEATNFYEDAPEEFLDPILSVVMRDPVKLPSSRQTIDRSTLAKHLLSNETDPFNREPLTMDMVHPDLELKERIVQWERKKRCGELATEDNDEAAAGDDKDDVPKLELPSPVVASDVEQASIGGGHSLGGGKLLPRIRKDIKTILREAPPGIWISVEESDMTLIHAVITGPEDTPYHGGYFYFRLRCPPNYPAAPPKAEIVTTDGGRVRFNPNLYRDGKVCLSILGTWEGPGWTPIMDLLKVLISIQSLMCENPFYNEPGHDAKNGETDPRSDGYNEAIAHETVRVAYLDMIQSPPADLPAELHNQV